jgi:hypothetical protein
MTMDATTDRRSLLKVGALAAAPLVAVAAPGLASDDSRARLARLEDEREIEALHRAFVRRVNGDGDCGAFVARAGAVTLDPGLRSIADDAARDATLEFAADGRSASSRRPVHVELETEFTGHTTLEQMTRFQGQGRHRRREAKVMVASYVKTQDGWQIARLSLA